MAALAEPSLAATPSPTTRPRGDTGDTAHRSVEDEASLVAELQSITGDVVSCTYLLEAEPTDPTFVLVTLDGEQKNLDDADGWTLDGRTVQLQGDACDTLQDGGDHVLSVQVRCEPVMPI